MKVLITGSNGFVGKSLVKRLKDYEVTCLKQGLNELPVVDAIVHLGARVDFNCDKNELFRPNVMSTANLVNWAKEIGAYFIYTSTAIVCGKNAEYITQYTRANPDTDYAYSKWLGEELIRMAGINHVILRLAGVYGLDTKLGINKSLLAAVCGLPITRYGDGKIKRTYVYVGDVVNIIDYCLKNKVIGTHLVAGEVMTINQMLQSISDTFSVKIEQQSGGKQLDQIVYHSELLPTTRTFNEALLDIKGGK